MWQALQKGWKPPVDVSEEEYVRIKNLTEPSALRGFVGTACSIFNIWFGTYARDPKNPKNFAAMAGRQMLRRMHGLKSINYNFRDYRTALDAVDANVIYLDPPYENTSSYAAVGAFDSKLFWDEVRKRSDGKRRILVSEYKAPKDFTVVLTAYSRMGLRVTTDTGVRQDLREERVFEFEPPKGRRQVSFGSLLEG